MPKTTFQSGRTAVAAGTEALGRACDDPGVRPGDLDRKRNVGLVIDDGSRSSRLTLPSPRCARTGTRPPAGASPSPASTPPCAGVNVAFEIFNGLALVYDPRRQWRRLSFDALRVFAQPDGLLELSPVGDAATVA